MGEAVSIATPSMCRQIEPTLLAKGSAGNAHLEATTKGELREQILSPESWLPPKHKWPPESFTKLASKGDLPPCAQLQCEGDMIAWMPASNVSSHYGKPVVSGLLGLLNKNKCRTQRHASRGSSVTVLPPSKSVSVTRARQRSFRISCIGDCS